MAIRTAQPRQLSPLLAMASAIMQDANRAVSGFPATPSNVVTGSLARRHIRDPRTGLDTLLSGSQGWAHPWHSPRRGSPKGWTRRLDIRRRRGMAGGY